MKLSVNTDFTKLPRSGKVVGADAAATLPTPFDLIVLEHDERHLRRKVLTLLHGDKVLVDLGHATMLENRDRLVLDDGRNFEVIAANELLYEVLASPFVPISHLAWHLGNRHLAAQIEENRILIRRDHVIRDMLMGLGASVSEISEPFQPLHGAYHSHGGLGHSHDAKLDKFGRLPGDPHYGHNHA